MEAADPSPCVTDFATLSRAVSRALRHEPWLFELELDAEGWTPAADLLAALRKEAPEWAHLNHVHMSEDTRSARLVGRRADPRPVILEIDAASASDAGVSFYRGSDVVWLGDLIPAKFIRTLETG